jgi:hypothetical protein
MEREGEGEEREREWINAEKNVIPFPPFSALFQTPNPIVTVVRQTLQLSSVHSVSLLCWR